MDEPIGHQGDVEAVDENTLENQLRAEIERGRLVNSKLDELYGRALSFCQTKLANFYTVAEQQSSLCNETTKLEGALKYLSKRSEELSVRVKELDMLQSRIEDSLSLVDDLMDLRTCAEQAESALGTGDYEHAAKHVSKYRHLQQAMLSAGSVLPSDEAVLNSLAGSEQKLTQIVRKEFDSAITRKDKAGVSRFAKLFYPLGLEKEGITRYIAFIRSFLAESGATSYRLLLVDPFKGAKGEQIKMQSQAATPYAEAITKIFVLIADIIQEHQQNIEEEFGPENFIHFLRGLQEESDVQGLKILDRFFVDKASILRLKAEDRTQVDLRAVDMVLEEGVVLSKRCKQFDNYIRSCGRNLIQTLSESSPSNRESPDAPTSQQQGLQAHSHHAHDKTANKRNAKEVLKALQKDGYSPEDGLPVLTSLMRRMQELTSHYVSVEHLFMLRSMRMAVQETDEVPWEDPDMMTSTLVDDVFFILGKSVTRSISTGDVPAVCAVLNHLAALVTTDLRAALADNLNESKRIYGSYIQDINHVRNYNASELIPEEFAANKDKMRFGAAYSFTHSLNNLQASYEYLDKLKHECEAEYDDAFGQASNSPNAKHNAHAGAGDPAATYRLMFEHCLQSLETAKEELQQMHKNSCKDTLNMLRCHLSPVLAPLDNLDFNIGQSDYADYQVNDPWAKQFFLQLELLVTHLKQCFTEPSVDAITELMLDRVCRRLEGVVMNKKFSLLGALQLDTDVRALMGFFAQHAQQSTRHKFGRLNEIGTLLNLEAVAELHDLYAGGSAVNWRLTAEEMRQVLCLRVDFNPSDVEKVVDSIYLR